MSRVMVTKFTLKGVKMENMEAVLARMRAVLGVKTDKQMCEILGIQYGTLDMWKVRKKIPKGKFLEIAAKLNVTPEYLESGTHISNNTNSVIVNGSNNGSIVNGHQVKVSQELMDFVELFKEYGSNAMLKKWKSELEANKARMQEDEIDEETIKYLFKSVKNFNENPELTSKALNQIMKTFNKVKEYDLNSGRKKAEELGSASE